MANLNVATEIQAIQKVLGGIITDGIRTAMDINNPNNRNRIAPPLVMNKTTIMNPYRNIPTMQDWDYSAGKTPQVINVLEYARSTKPYEATIELPLDEVLEDATGLLSTSSLQADMQQMSFSDALEYEIGSVLTGQSAIMTLDGKTFFATDHPFTSRGSTGAWSNYTVSGTATATTPTFILAFCQGGIAPMNTCFTNYGSAENAFYGGATKLLNNFTYGRITATDVEVFDKRLSKLSVESKYVVGGFMPAFAHKFVGKFTTENIEIAMANYAKQRLPNGMQFNGGMPNTIIVHPEHRVEALKALKTTINGGETNVLNAFGLQIVTNNYMKAKAS